MLSHYWHVISQLYLGVVNVLETNTKFCTQRNLKGWCSHIFHISFSCMNSNTVSPHNRTISYSYELPMCVVARSRWICNMTLDFELCTFSWKKMHIGRPTMKPHVTTWNDHATQLRYNILMRGLQNYPTIHIRYNVDGL